MSTADWPLLELADEEALHLERLLSVDERVFHRITKRLLAADAVINRLPPQLPTPPPEITGESTSAELPGSDPNKAARAHFRDDTFFDFAQFEAFLIRIQNLKNANERERVRYASERDKILATAEAVRANTAELRVQLAEAQEMLALKKQYDGLAEAITKDKALKARDVLKADNEKLEADVEELRQEILDSRAQWRDRKQRFNAVVNEGKALVGYLKGEDGEQGSSMEGEDDSGDGDEMDTKGDDTYAGTPRPDAGGATPMRGDNDGDGVQNAQQMLAQRAIGSSLHVPGENSSRTVSPAPSSSGGGDSKDTEMGDSVASPMPAAQPEQSDVPTDTEPGEFTEDADEKAVSSSGEDQAMDD